jgi:hypothetical protein
VNATVDRATAELTPQCVEREDVGARIGLKAFDVLRRHALNRSEDRTLRGRDRVLRPGELSYNHTPAVRRHWPETCGWGTTAPCS